MGRSSVYQRTFAKHCQCFDSECRGEGRQNFVGGPFNLSYVNSIASVCLAQLYIFINTVSNIFN